MNDKHAAELSLREIRAERRRRAGIVALGLLALISYVALLSLDLIRAREREQRAAQDRLAGLSRILESQAHATVDKIDTILQAAQLHLSRQPSPFHPKDGNAINAMLAAHLASIGESQSLRVANAQGRFIYDATGELSSATIDDRAYFLRNRDDSSGRLVISEPIFARITHNWVITLSRRLTDAQGHFAGLVQAAVRSEYFRDFYASLDLPSSYSVTLIDEERRMIARYPPAPEHMGKAINNPILDQFIDSGSRERFFETRSAVVGTERSYVIRKVGDFPLYITIGRDTDTILAAWRRQATFGIGGMLVLTFVVTGWIVVWLRTYDKARKLAGEMTAAYEASVQKFRHLAEHDPLTDLPNRSLLGEHMATALAETIGDRDALALLFLDLDHFKDVNDTLGHAIGDKLLIQVAQRLRDTLHEHDTLSRQGGDEFAILLRDYASPTRIAEIAQRLIDVLEQPFQVDGHELLISASIGISTYPQDGTDIGVLLKNADTAMYQAKAAGGSAYRFFTAEMNSSVLERVAMVTSLRQALARGEFALHFQPQVDGDSSNITGVEALIRWHHPQQGEIPPARFISIAEESGLINGIGQWVLAEACRQAKAWADEGLPAVTMAVNLSATQLRQPDLADKVELELSRSGLPAQCLELEITESALIGDTERIVGMLEELRALGIRLSVDDFGTGYSSLGYLKRLPFDKIKIDQSFVRGLPESEDDAAITLAIIGIADSLKKELIAEGVETKAQRVFLLNQGCRQMQGFHFGRPMPAHDIAQLLRAQQERS